MQVPELKECVRLCIIHHIIGIDFRNKQHEVQRENLLQQLDEGAWGEESLAILNRVVKQQGYYLFPEVILALLPNTTKELCLKECPQLTEHCLDVALQRCQHLESLDITENPLLDLSNIPLFGSCPDVCFSLLSTVILEDCSQVKDNHVQSLLKNAPVLRHLNIARCEITDMVFLLDKQTQLAREACFQDRLGNGCSVFNSNLQIVDVSRCSEFTSTGVRHLCTLCGPTLRSINVAWTKVDCSAFLYLSGLGLPSAVEFFMASGAVSSEVMEPLVYSLHQFDAICVDIAHKWRDVKLEEEEDPGDDSPGTQRRNEQTAVCMEDVCPELDTFPNDGDSMALMKERILDLVASSSVDPLTCDKRIKTTFPDNDDTADSKCMCESSPTFQVICLDDFLETPLYSKDNFMPKNIVRSEDGAPCNMSTSSSEVGNLKCEGNLKEKHSENITCRDELCKESFKDNPNGCNESDACVCNSFHDLKVVGEAESSCDTEPSVMTSVSAIQGKDETINSENTSVDSGFVTNVDKSEASCKAKQVVVTDGEDLVLSSETNSCNESQGKERRKMEEKLFFTSDVQTIHFTATVFREETLGLRCFQKFLTMNKNVQAINLHSGISGNFLTDNVLDLIGSYARGVDHLCVEGGDRLTTTGLLEIAQHCKSLTSLDLTGVSFIGDEGIVPLVKSLSLSHLKLAETRITGYCLNQLAASPVAKMLLEIDLSWCEEVESNESINQLVSSCPLLQRLMLRECCISNTTLACIGQHCHRITQLSLASNMNVMRDESVILLSENLPSLTFIDLGWNTYLTNPSIEALLTNCRQLTRANLEGLKLITSNPFLPLIAVPEEVCDYLEVKREEYRQSHPFGDSDQFMNLSSLPSLPHRSRTYGTKLSHVNLTYSDFVEDVKLQQIVTVTNGGIEILDYYGNKVEPCKASLEKFLIDFLDDFLDNRGKLI